MTTNRRSGNAPLSFNKLWSDWTDASVRDLALVGAFRHLDIDARVALADNAATGHGRLLEIRFSSGKVLTARINQGVSYWRAARSSGRAAFFDTATGASSALGRQVAEIAVPIEGGSLPTQIFVKLR